MIMIVGIIAILVIAAGGFFYVQNSASKNQAVEKHEDGTAHTEGDTHQDESKPHVDTTPHPVDESKPHVDTTPHPSESAESTNSGRKPAAVGDDHQDSAPHAEDEPHN